MDGGFDIAISGPESSGKTALAVALAVHYQTWYVPEYARTYLERHGHHYTATDLDAIVAGQLQWWEWPKAPTGKIRFWDGDAAILHVWQTLKFSTENERLTEWVKHHRPALTILCAPDLPWSYDPLRENEHDREALFERYPAVLEEWKHPFVVVSGSGELRLRRAIAAIEAAFGHPSNQKRTTTF
jgi:nicotinamide riboside kinase